MRTTKPRAERWLLVAIMRMLRWKGNPLYRNRRYAFVLVPPLAGVWVAVAAYCTLVPDSFRSTMVLNLPGAGANASINLSDIGQTSTSASTPFGDKSLSPKVIYQEIARSRLVVGKAAKRLGIAFEDFPAPRIKLIDQTALLTFIMDARSAEMAQKLNVTLREELSKQLDKLRKDEIDRRAGSIRESLKEVKQNLEAARKELLDFQASSPVISVDQFKAMAVSLEQLQQKLTERRAQLEQVTKETAQLERLLKLPANVAAAALELQADPTVAGLLTRRAEALGKYRANHGRWGQGHPQMISLRVQLASVESALRERAGHVQPGNTDTVLDVLALAVQDSKQAELLHSLVQLEVRRAGLAHAVSSTTRSVENLKKKIDAASMSAAQLADLERDHKIAETVFSSALARVDTERQDVYASYPLIQVLAPATLPSRPSGPRRGIAIAGGVAGSIFIILGLCLLWYRQKLARKLLKSI